MRKILKYWSLAGGTTGLGIHILFGQFGLLYLAGVGVFLIYAGLLLTYKEFIDD